MTRTGSQSVSYKRFCLVRIYCRGHPSIALSKQEGSLLLLL
ncbi:hypothetical protein JMJ77_0012673, partial [Colletotrichum scovillei]